MPQSSAPITGVNLSDVDWRDSFGDEAGVLGDLDGTAYKIALPPGDSDVLQVGSTTQRSMARVGGFIHRIPASETEPLTIPAASGSARTDIAALRYDPSFTGAPGPVRLTRIAGTSSGIPTYDDAAPGVEDLPLWAITRQPGQALSQATVRQLFPRLAPSLDLPAGAPLPLSSPLGTIVRQGGAEFVRALGPSSVPVWERRPFLKSRFLLGTASGTLANNTYVNLITDQTIPAAAFGSAAYQLRVNASVRCNFPPGLGGVLQVLINGVVFGADEHTNGGTQTNSHTLRLDEVAYVDDAAARTIRVRLLALAGQINVNAPFQRVFIEATPYGAL